MNPDKKKTKKDTTKKELVLKTETRFEIVIDNTDDCKCCGEIGTVDIEGVNTTKYAYTGLCPNCIKELAKII